VKNAKWWQILLAVLGGVVIALGVLVLWFAAEESGVAKNCYTGIVGGNVAVICPPNK
jgi:hypothetical protein